ncbi:MAG TPA: hypothetical protein VEG38_14520 [Acidimicrobiia bacterium]|nr:hypothetical protein [Acidimicrobiia bacterium]
MAEAANPALALRDLRRARHHRHREDFDWVETLYRVYVTVLSGAAVIWLTASRVADDAAGGRGLDEIRQHGSAVLGLTVGFLVALGLRSGSRGGPLSLEAADVRVVLLAPVRRRVALRAPAVRQVRSAAFGGLCVGAVVGNLAGQRLPGRFAGWVVAGAAFGLVAGLLSVGVALLACGLRVNRRVATALGLGALGWAAADVAAGTTSSPFTLIGRIGLAPLPGEVAGGSPQAAVAGGVVLTSAVLAAAAARLGHMSLEAAERRGRLAAQLRFALSLQDLRAVILLRRRLAAEEPRARPWIRLPDRRRRPPGVPEQRQVLRRDPGLPDRDAVAVAGGPEERQVLVRNAGSEGPAGAARGRLGLRRSGFGPGAAVRRRGLHSLLRWPVTRILRVVGLGVVAGFAGAGAWEGTTPLVIVAGVALFVAALDALEPLAQEWDHPGRRDSFPLLPGRIATASLLVPSLVLGVVTAAGVALAIPILGVDAGPMVLTILPATAAAVAGGTASLVLEPVSAAELMSRYPVPEAAGPVLVVRLGFAPGLAISGWLPLLAGRAAIDQEVSPGAAVFQSGIAVVGLSVLVVRALCQHFERKRAIPEP